MEGQNGWERPSVGSSYNEANGKIAITRKGLGKMMKLYLKLLLK